MQLDLEILGALKLRGQKQSLSVSRLENNNKNQHSFIHFISSYLEAVEGEAATGY